jgi:3-hydroxyisobutyrate dehydrogenase-like beta-hydroxyacid dehydrogenase
MATISMALVEELLPLHRTARVGYVAAPVFGVPAAAAQQQLNIVVAGEADAVATVQPLLDVLGRKSWPLGADPRRANIAKLGGNLIIALAIEAMSEASALTESHGLAATDFLDIITNTIMNSPAYQRYGGYVAKRSYEPGFKLTLGLKDVRLALAAAATTGAQLPSAGVLRERMELAVERGFGAKDWSVVAEIARDPG